MKNVPEIHVSIATGLSFEFDDILKFFLENKLMNFCEIRNGVITLSVYFKGSIQRDVKDILAFVEHINKIYEQYGYPYKAIEILNNEIEGKEDARECLKWPLIREA